MSRMPLTVSLLASACTEMESAGRAIGHGARDAAEDVAAATKRVIDEAAQ